jgi:hypothetical protein
MPVFTGFSINASSTGCGKTDSLVKKYPTRGWWTSAGGAFEDGEAKGDLTLELTLKHDLQAKGLVICNAEGDRGAKTLLIEHGGFHQYCHAEATEEPQDLSFDQPLDLVANQTIRLKILENHGMHFVALRGIGIQWELDESNLFTNDDFDSLEQVIGEDYEEKGGSSIEWKRPCEIFNHETVSLFDNIDPGDIGQGSWGNCWLMSSLAAFAEFPEVLESRFTPRYYSEDGKYTINIYDPLNDQWAPIEVDDRIPCKNERPIGGRPKGNELWVLLYEKAVSQFAGSYTALGHGGPPVWALMVLCGSSAGVRYQNNREEGEVKAARIVIEDKDDDGCLSIKDYNLAWGTWPDGSRGWQPKSPEEFMAVLAHHDEQNHVMVAYTAHSQTSEMHGSTDRGIFLNHAYTLISVHRNVAGSGRDFVLLRNPHGHGEWEGPWGDSSDEWGDEGVADIASALLQVFPSAEDDGVFFMESSDFLEVFDNVDVVAKSMREKKRALAIRDQKMEAEAKGIEEDMLPSKPARVNNQISMPPICIACPLM